MSETNFNAVLAFENPATTEVRGLKPMVDAQDLAALLGDPAAARHAAIEDVSLDGDLLHLQLLCGDLVSPGQLIKSLLRLEPKLALFEMVGDDGETQLTRAFSAGTKASASQVRKLLAERDPSMAVALAIRKFNEKLALKAIRAAGVNPSYRSGGNALAHLALDYGMHAAFRALVIAGADPGARHHDPGCGGHGDTILHRVIEYARTDLLEVILGRIEDVDVRDAQGCTALLTAAARYKSVVMECRSHEKVLSATPEQQHALSAEVFGEGVAEWPPETVEEELAKLRESDIQNRAYLKEMLGTIIKLRGRGASAHAANDAGLTPFRVAQNLGDAALIAALDPDFNGNREANG